MALSPRAAPRLLPGDPAPWFHAATASNPRYNFAGAAGRYVLLAFLGPASAPASAAALAQLQAAQAAGQLDGIRAAGFAAVLDPPGGVADRLPGLRMLSDRDLAVSRLYGAAIPAPETGGIRYVPQAILLDPMLRVIEVVGIDRLPALLDRLAALPDPALHAGQETPAPVLLLPRVFEPEFCAELVRVYEAQGGTESGFMIERDGRTIGVYDHANKRRRDCQIEDEALQAQLRARMVRRLSPEMKKAFQFEPTRIERYIIACYDAAEGGHFRAHRDNTTPATAHRRFAVTINLNEDFDGGELWFPEFGSRRYRPPLGGAVVFSCSLLHEATPVSRGIRYATLPFLYDDAAAKLREAGQATLVSSAPPPG